MVIGSIDLVYGKQKDKIAFIQNDFRCGLVRLNE